MQLCLLQVCINNVYAGKQLHGLPCSIRILKRKSNQELQKIIEKKIPGWESNPELLCYAYRQIFYPLSHRDELL